VTTRAEAATHAPTTRVATARRDSLLTTPVRQNE
jgi:hypothetical protein